MSFWSSQTLKSRLPNLIEPFNEERIDSASYELSLGEEVYISPLPDTLEGDRRKVILKKGETVPIPPGQFAFLITFEKVSISSNAIAFISMKFKPKAKGLINVSGFHVDPGYKGRLIFAVYNAGPLNFQVEYGEQLFSIWFADLDAVDDRARTKDGFSSIPTDILNVPDLVSSLPYLVKRLNNAEENLAKRQENLVERLVSMEKKVEAYSAQQAVLSGVIVGTVASAVVAFVVALGAFIPGVWLLLNTNNARPVETLPSPRPIPNPNEVPRERKQLDQPVDSAK